jgi:transposase-like protein
LKDILIACIENLTGFAEAIAMVFSKVEIQSCVVHQIRNSLKYVAPKDQKAFTKEFKCVDQALNKIQA